MKTETAEELWNYTAESLEEFINRDDINVTKHEELDNIPLDFTFSYPATQGSIDHGVYRRGQKDSILMASRVTMWQFSSAKLLGGGNYKLNS